MRPSVTHRDVCLYSTHGSSAESTHHGGSPEDAAGADGSEEIQTLLQSILLRGGQCTI